MLKVNKINVSTHENVFHGVDETTGLEAIVGVHNTNLGPALGGCRAMTYGSINEQINDVLNLSKGMTYKSALAGLKLGGGKSTINLKGGELTSDILKSFGEMLNEINKEGDYYFTAGDVGTGTDDLAELRKHTRFVNGDSGTDSGIATAYGVFNAMKGALRFLDEGFEQQQVSVTGFGKVGKRLAGFLVDAGAQVVVSDKFTSVEELPLVTGKQGRMDYRNAHRQGSVFAPCAVGGAINEKTVTEIPEGHLICGGANNQIANESLHGTMLARSLTYVPDYLANAGGVIIINKRSNDYVDLEYDSPKVKPKLEAIADTTFEILTRAEKEGVHSAIIANKMAEEIFNAS